ncbi:MAG: hypothetical protein QXK80_01385 [Candidatus Pacearchaeota archaeon]
MLNKNSKRNSKNKISKKRKEEKVKEKKELEKKIEKINSNEFDFQFEITFNDASTREVPVLRTEPITNTNISISLEDSLNKVITTEKNISEKSKKEEKLYFHTPVHYDKDIKKYATENNEEEKAKEFEESIIGPLHKKWHSLREKNKANKTEFIEMQNEQGMREMIFEEIKKYEKKYNKLERENEAIERPERKKDKIKYYWNNTIIIK